MKLEKTFGFIHYNTNFWCNSGVMINKDLINKEFEFVKVIKETELRTWSGNIIWEVKCCCGNIVFWSKHQILHYRTCGCKKVELHREKVWKGCGKISGEFFSTIRKNAKNRKLDFEIDVKDVWILYLKQNGKCSLTGENIHFGNETELKTASLDRIDSNKGYTKDNIQWVHKIVNFMKQQFGENEFIEWCGRVYNFNK